MSKWNDAIGGRNGLVVLVGAVRAVGQLIRIG